ncbi:hypothetical protein GYA93_19580 [Gordonia desulfuricans]|uniref:Recombinase RecT n=1 Tax=Gordonia desulfuricans TaxID=89051 RepID=A0A7K3LUJ9_9ACTN|nr:hypothetical protein [Gordonia desulfuricans]NDK91756.1 hypothetical protein [Gordonia desulfuricans]
MTTNEIATTDDNGLSLLPPAQPMQSSSINTLMEHARAMNTAYELAEKMCGTQLVPQIYRGKPQDGTAAILYGAELGLTPIQSLQQIFVVHGTPAIYTRTMVALLKRRGFRIWTESSTDESVTVMGQAPDGTAEASTWTIERATRAGYVPTINETTGKFKTNANGKLIGNEKYLTDPQAMLYAKAAAEVCRKLAPEVLLGLSVDDETEPRDEGAPRKVRNEAAVRAPGVDELRARLGVAAKSRPIEAAAEPTPVDTPEHAAEQETNAPSRDALMRLNALFERAGLGGKTAAVKAKKKTVTEALLGRSVDDLTADDVEHLTSQLDQLTKEGENSGQGDDLLVATVASILEEKAADQ